MHGAPGGLNTAFSHPADVLIGSDTDLDGIQGGIEDLAPGAGDGNQDSIPDRLQADVASLPTATSAARQPM